VESLEAQTARRQACNDVAKRNEFAVTGLAQRAADGAWSVIGLGLKAPKVSRSDTAYQICGPVLRRLRRG
jgi:hypothetical protein